MSTGPQPLDPSQFEDATEEVAAAPVASAAPAQTATPMAKPLNMADFEDVPAYVSGMEETAPIPKSPLSIEDRLKLSVGNDKGRINYLKQKYEDAKYDADKNLLVKDKGLWHMADGTTFGDSDAWTATKNIVKTTLGIGASIGGAKAFANQMFEGNDHAKELAGDMADMSPELAQLATTLIPVGAGAKGVAQVVMAGSKAAGIAGANAGVRTSLGRYVGTYDATPEEQAKDIAFESLLNFGGVVVPAGIKPTAKMVGQGIYNLGETLKVNAVGRGTIEGLKKIYGALSIGEDNLDTVIEHAPRVRATMEEVASNFKGAGYVDHLKGRSIQAVKQVSNYAQDVLNDSYTSIKGKLLSSVKPEFTANVDDIIHNVHSDFINNKFAKVVGADGKALTDDAFQTLMARTSGKLPQGYQVVLKTKNDILKTMKAMGDFGDGANLGIDDDAYKMMSKYFHQLTSLKGAAGKTGKEAAEQLLNFNKLAGDVTYALKEQGDEQSLNVISRMMAKQNELIEGNVRSALDKGGAQGLFDSLNQNYSYLKEQAAPLLKAKRAAAKNGDAAYEQLLTQMVSKPGKNVTKKLGVDALVDYGMKNGSKSADAIFRLKEQVRVNEAAIAVAPYFREGLLGTATATGAVTGMLATGGTAALPILGGVATQSPRLALKGTEAINSLWAGKEFAAKYGSQLISNPEAMNAFLQTVVDAPELGKQAEQMLRAQAAQKIQGQ